jgi:hypothetical protein
MTQLSELRLINDSNILYFKKINRSYKRNEIIKNILNDETCFFKMNKNDAYMILQDIGILNNQIDNIYEKLISFDEFYNLYECKKIDLNDEELLIKYPIYNADELFKNKITSDNNYESIHKDMELIPYKESFLIKILNRIKKIFGR